MTPFSSRPVDPITFLIDSLSPPDAMSLADLLEQIATAIRHKHALSFALLEHPADANDSF